MSWGCADQVRLQTLAQLANQTDKRVAVLGAGVMGLTAASLLSEAGVDVRIYAEKRTPHTTSDVAGGQWAPSVVEYSDANRHRAILSTSFKTHQSRGASYGVSARDNYTFVKSPELDWAALAGAAAPVQLGRLPFGLVTQGGWKYPTLLVEPPILMPKLEKELLKAGVTFAPKTFLAPSSVEALSEPTVVNCLGLGSRKVWPDSNLRGVKGQLALLPPQPGLHYLYSGIGYMFPRHDHVVVGGSLHFLASDNEDATPDPEMGRVIIRVVRAVFQGGLPIPPWFSGRERALAS